MKLNTGSDFFKESRKVAQRFLRTVLLVDDSPEAEGVNRSSTEVIVPPPDVADAIAGVDVPPTAAPTTEHEDSPQPLPGFDAIREFARKGMLATVVRTEEGRIDSDLADVKLLASKADVVILDWYIPGSLNDGKFALQVIQALAADGHANALRLVVLYTGHTTPQDALAEVQSVLGAAATLDDEALAVSAGPIRVVILTKPSGATERIAAEARREVSVTSLPETILDEFTQLTAGLLSNVALASLAVVRESTHTILATFPRRLDVPFIAHRMQCNPPGAAEDLAQELVADEIQSALVRGGLSEHATASTVGTWLGAHFRETWNATTEYDAKNKAIQTPFDTAALSKLADEGIARFVHPVTNRKFSRKTQDEFHKTATPSLGRAFGFAAPDDLDNEFAFSSTHSSARSSQPILTQGTILARDSDASVEYLLCVQPRCDTVRVNGQTRFLFASCKTGGGAFNLVTKDGDQFKRLKVELSAKSAEALSFSGPVDGLIVGTWDVDRHVFRSTDGKELRWVGQLKRGAAQRLTAMFAANVGRIGIDEYEWLRRFAGAADATE